MPKFYYSRDLESSPKSVAKLHDLFLKISGGDVLTVPSIDHLAERWADLYLILDCLAGKGVILRPLHTSGRRGEPPEVGFKRDLRRAATERARVRGSYLKCTGRPSIDRAKARQLRDGGMKPADIAAELGAGKSAVYAALREG
jgi:DNA invertase Pin-like site-specific DNA recombinase